MDSQCLEIVSDLQSIKEISYPAGTNFREILVTGPPGSGKSTLVQHLGGWPEEGLVDLSAPHWWRSRDLSARPRQIHFAFPFKGQKDSLAVHDALWVAHGPELRLATERVRLPTKGLGWGFDWRRRYLFDVQLPPEDDLLRAREERAQRGSHPVDRNLSRELVRLQLDLYRSLAELLHEAGFRVIVRTQYDGAPRVFPPVKAVADAERGQRSFLSRWVKRLARHDSAPILEDVEGFLLRGAMVRVPKSALPITADVGGQTVAISPLETLDGAPTDRLVLYDPDRIGTLYGRVRLAVGQGTRLGRGAEDRFITRSLPKDALPRLEILNRLDDVLLIDLDSPHGTRLDPAAPALRGALIAERRRARDRLREIFPEPERPLATAEALDLLRRVTSGMPAAGHRELDRDGRPGGILRLPDSVTPIVVGDLHTRIEHLLGVLTQNRFLHDLEAGRAALVILGDAVHSEESSGLEDMASSISIMDRILTLIDRFPGGVFYLLGNHDSFSPDVRKNSVPQGLLWRAALVEERGEEYVAAMQEFYDASPYVLEAKGIIACHGGPPTESVTREALVNIEDSPRIRHQLTWNRLRSPNNPAGYGKRDVRKFLGALGQPRSAFIVSHTPPSGDELYQRNVGGIAGHHVIHSADPDGYSIATRLDGEVALLEFDAEPWT
ncbi:MAG: metallophosphoesterase [Thermoanaerobaculia bacterium]|nr:metallophosphoesterase [Thermoanaerobaculia bacterium]